MKYLKTYTTNAHPPATVYDIRVGKEEVELLLKLVESARKYMPRYTETQIAHGRLRNMLKELSTINKLH